MAVVPRSGYRVVSLAVMGPTRVPLRRRALAEFVGTAFLAAAGVGSAIAAARLSPGDAGLQLFEAAAVTGAALVAIIFAVGPVSGAHLNPAISIVARVLDGLTDRELGVYVAAQLTGAVLGAVVANLMFALPAAEIATIGRAGPGVWLAEAVATLGLLLVVFGTLKSGARDVVPFVVGAYVAAAYFFTSSTSFVNPAVTAARTLSDTPSGIRPAHAPGFIVAQFVGAAAAVMLLRALYPDVEESSGDAVIPSVDAGP